ncbi:MAG: hypothetical protein U0871_03775 [Gemmataceae bacterium]
MNISLHSSRSCPDLHPNPAAVPAPLTRLIVAAAEELLWQAVGVFREAMAGPDRRLAFRAATQAVKVYTAHLRHGRSGDTLDLLLDEAAGLPSPVGCVEGGSATGTHRP